MLYDTPIEAYVLCYGPLVITVLGFILFAIMTDGDARRTYLRRLMGRKPERATKAVHAQTPAGVRVTILPDDRVQNGEQSQPASPAPPAAAPPPAPAAPVEPASEPDDLTRIEGIGPKMSQALIAAGLDTFEKVAAASIEDFQAAVAAAGMNFAPSAESWAEQASYAARGDWDGLSAFQSTLISGRYPPND